MQIDAILQSLIAQGDFGSAGIESAALGFKDLKDTDDAFRIITGCLHLGEVRLLQFGSEEFFLSCQRAFDRQCRLDFAESLESDLGKGSDGDFVSGQRLAGLGSGRAATVDRLSQ